MCRINSKRSVVIRRGAIELWHEIWITNRGAISDTVLPHPRIVTHQNVHRNRRKRLRKCRKHRWQRLRLAREWRRDPFDTLAAASQFPFAERRGKWLTVTNGRAIITMRIESSADRLRCAQEESRILQRWTLDDAVNSVSVSLMIKLCTKQIRRIDAVKETTLKVCLCRKERLRRGYRGFSSDWFAEAVHDSNRRRMPKKRFFLSSLGFSFSLYTFLFVILSFRRFFRRFSADFNFYIHSLLSIVER